MSEDTKNEAPAGTGALDPYAPITGKASRGWELAVKLKELALADRPIKQKFQAGEITEEEAVLGLCEYVKGEGFVAMSQHLADLAALAHFANGAYEDIHREVVQHYSDEVMAMARKMGLRVIEEGDQVTITTEPSADEEPAEEEVGDNVILEHQGVH